MSENERNIKMTRGGNESAVDAFYNVRKRCLNLKPEEIRLRLDKDDQVYGAVIDMQVNDGELHAFLWCCFDGMVSIFNENGTGIIGISKKVESVKNAALKFLYNAGQALSCCEPAKSYELSYDGRHIVHLLTRRGVYKTFIDVKKIKEEPKEKQFLYMLYNTVMYEIAMSGKDVPAKPEGDGTK